jgi:hypothetical protein
MLTDNGAGTENAQQAAADSERVAYQHRREAIYQETDSRRELERLMMERDMPAVTVTKGDLGPSWCQIKIDPDQQVAIKPIVVEETEDHPRQIALQITKGQDLPPREPPPVTAQPLDAQTLAAHPEAFPRNYRRIGHDEIAWQFNDRAGNPVGWAVVDARSQTTHDCHLGFIGISQEGQGYGEAVLGWLKQTNQSINLTPLAYLTNGKGKDPDAAKERLKRFYVRGGFVFVESGHFSWSRREANLEDARPGESFVTRDELVADGTRYSQGDLYRTYFRTLAKQRQLESTFGDQAPKALAWLEAKETVDRLFAGR